MLLFSEVGARACKEAAQRQGKAREVTVPSLMLDQALPYASLRPRGLGDEPEEHRLPIGMGIIEIPFTGDIAVFDIRPEEPFPIPLGETRGSFVRLLVPLSSSGAPNEEAVLEAVERTEACLVWHRDFWAEAAAAA